MKYIDWGKDTSYRAWQQSSLLSARQSLTELTLICTIAGEWGQLTCQPCHLIPVDQIQSHKVKTVELYGLSHNQYLSNI